MNTARLNDALQLLKKASFRKLLNGVQLLVSYYWSKLRKQPLHSGLPLSLAIEPTTACNLRCPECPSGLRSFTRPTGKLPLPLFQKIIDEVKDHLLYLTLYFQGEPYLHPQFLDMVSYASANGIYTATSTNAHFLTDDSARQTVTSGLNRLIISIDGTTQESYSAYRKEGKLAEVIEGTKRIVAWKKKLKSKTPHVVFQFLVVKPNEHEIAAVKKLGKELGVDEVKIKSAQIYDYQNGSDLIPSIARYSRYRENGEGKWTLKNQLHNECWKMWHSCVITWDGKVVPCCFDKDASHAMGSVTQYSLRDVWTSPAYRTFRQSILSSRKEIDICKNCSEGGPVWV